MSVDTYYASSARSSFEEIQKEQLILKERLFILTILDSLPSIVLVLNKNRQAIYCNQNLLKQMRLIDENTILGQRPGEIMHCKNAENSPTGCGTSLFCRHCDAVEVILEGLNGHQLTRECQISADNNGIHETIALRVTGIPFSLDNETYVCFSINNINEEKKLNMLENLFIHDISNTATVVQCITDLILRIDDKEEIKELLKYLSQTTMQLTEEIQAHKQVLMAEKGELDIQVSVIPSSLDILDDLKNQYASHKCALGKQIIIDQNSRDCSFTTDLILLKRVMSNLIKNALEESTQNDMVIIGVYTGTRNSLIFFVKNSQVMSEEVQANLFKRTFSTKGQNRGLGTYSIQLFTEKYLKGKVYFKSEDEFGTVFYIEIPMFYERPLS